MKKYRCSLPTVKGHSLSFVAFQYGKEDLPDVVPLSSLERKVSPGFKEVVDEVTIEVDLGNGKSQRQVQRTHRRVRRAQESLGRPVNRKFLEVEAASEHDAAAIFLKAVGVNEQGTSRKVKCVLVGADAPAPAPAPAKGLLSKSPDEAARQLMGDRLPPELE